jgi:hypothetical protein
MARALRLLVETGLTVAEVGSGRAMPIPCTSAAASGARTPPRRFAGGAPADPEHGHEVRDRPGPNRGGPRDQLDFRFSWPRTAPFGN